jgi:hypothetical protein
VNQKEKLSVDEVRAAFHRARVPEVPEIQQLFRLAQPRVIEIASSLETGR